MPNHLRMAREAAEIGQHEAAQAHAQIALAETAAGILAVLRAFDCPHTRAHVDGTTRRCDDCGQTWDAQPCGHAAHLTETNFAGETHCHQCGHTWKENP